MSQTIHSGQSTKQTGSRGIKALPKSAKLAGVIVLVGLTAVGIGFRMLNRGATSVPTYKEVQVRRGDIDVTILSTGVVQPENRVEIKPPIAGRVEKVLVTEGTYVKKGQVLAWMSSTERAALLDAAAARGPDELKEWEEMYRPTPILAPINGRIILRNVESGQTFATTEAILVMSDRLTVKAQVDETDIAQIKVGQEAAIVLDAYPKERIPARVDQIAFDAKTVNNVTTYIVDVLPNKAPEVMRSGMTANVTFVVDRRKDVLVVPSEALVSTERGRSKVLVPGKAPAPNFRDAVEREIRTGISDGKTVEVLSGLSENETILRPDVRLPSSRSNSGASSPFSPMRPSSSGRGR